MGDQRTLDFRGAHRIQPALHARKSGSLGRHQLRFGLLAHHGEPGPLDDRRASSELLAEHHILRFRSNAAFRIFIAKAFRDLLAVCK